MAVRREKNAPAVQNAIAVAINKQNKRPSSNQWSFLFNYTLSEASPSSKPAFICDPSQNGLFLD